MKKIALTFIAAGLLLVGCKDNASDKEAQAEDNLEVNTTTGEKNPDEMQYADASLEQSYAIDFESMDYDEYEVDPQVRAEIQSWEELNTINVTMEEIEVPEADIPTYGDRLVTEAANLKNTIPQSLMTEEVEEDIKDINEEVADLKAILDKEGVNENEIDRQVEELIEAYDDLNEEINETIKQKSKKMEAKAEAKTNM